jgi:hypothetical protein
MFSDRRTGRRLFTAAVLARTAPLQQRMPSLCRPAQQASGAALLQEESTAVRDQVGSPASPLQAEEGRVLGVRRAGSAAATHTISSTLVVAGLMVLLGVFGTAVSIVHGITGPVRRAVRVQQAPGSRGLRLRPATLHELHESVADIGARTVIATVVQQAQRVALDATIESARSGGADRGSPAITPRGEEPAASSVATTRYAAARSRALGPTTALWHAVELDRLVGAVGVACETTVCGSLVRVSTDQRWPVPARDVCPACSTLAH